MATMSLEELYERYIKPLPVSERLRLVAMTAQDMAQQNTKAPVRRAWREIAGTAPYPLVGEDAQAWVSRSRREDDTTREKRL